LTDTAGIRRRASVDERLEKVSVLTALRALERSDLAALVVDATEPGVDQDARLASLVEERGRGLIVVVNKWDLARRAGKTEEEFRAYLKHRLKFIGYAPIVFVSALEGAKVEKVLEVASQLADQFHFRVPTPRLNRLLEEVTEFHPAPLARGKPLRLYFIRQVRTAPPTFALTANRPADIPDSYRRYLANQLRGAFGLKVPIHLVFKDRPGQAKRQARKRPK
jgi:GTP-binding protein